MISITDIQKILINLEKNLIGEKLDELAQSIKENGVIQPIIVRQSPVIGYEILCRRDAISFTFSWSNVYPSCC